MHKYKVLNYKKDKKCNKKNKIVQEKKKMVGMRWITNN